MNCPHTIRVYKHHVHSYRGCQSISLKSVWCTITKIWFPYWSSTCTWNVSQRWSYSLWLQNKSRKNSRGPFSWSSMCMRTSTDEFHRFRYCLTSWSSRYTQKGMVTHEMLREENAQPMFVQPLMIWSLTTLKLKVKQPSTDQKLDIKVKAALGKEELFLLSNLTSCFQNALIPSLHWSLWWRAPSSYDPP